MTAHALDSQPLAIGGGFTLVRQDVRIDDLACVAFNIPMFEQHGLEITKSVDGQRVEIGDVVTYRINVNNPTARFSQLMWWFMIGCRLRFITCRHRAFDCWLSARANDRTAGD